MKFWKSSFNLFICHAVFGDWLKDVSYLISQNLNPYQVIVVDDLNEKQKKKLKFIHEYPSVTVNFRNNSNFSKVKGFIDKSIILFYIDHLPHAKNLMEIIEQLSPVQMRPKCLIIYITSDSVSKNTLKPIFEYAWDLKFLEFTILIPNYKKNISTMFHFNPFFNTVNEESLTKDSLIFPDKLKNGNGYVLNLDLPFPMLGAYAVPNKHGKMELGYQEQIISNLVYESLNFTVLKLSWHENKNVDNLTMVMDAYPRIYYYFFTEELRVFSFTNNHGFFVAVPIFSTKRPVSDPVKTAAEIMVLFVIIKIFVCLMERLKVIPGRFTGLEIIQLLLGQGVHRDPRSTTSRIVFLTVTTLVSVYAGEVYMKIVEENFDYLEVPFESFEDLDKSQLPMETMNDKIIPYVLNKSSNEFLRNMAAKTRLLVDERERDCMERLKSSKNLTCVLSASIVEILINQERYSEYAKVAKPPLMTTKRFFLFENASPYADEFYKVYQKVSESGIRNSIHMLDGLYYSYEYVDVERKVDSSFNKRQLLVVTLFGYCISSFVFLVEILLGVDKIKRIAFYRCGLSKCFY